MSVLRSWNFQRCAWLGCMLGCVCAQLCGCARRQMRFEDMAAPKPTELKVRLEANRAALHDFEGSGIIEMAGGSMGRGALGIKLNFLQPDILWISLNGPMGIDLGSLLLQQDRYQLSYGMPRVHAEGRIADFAFPAEIGFEMQGEDVLNIMLPLAFLFEVPDSATVQKDPVARQYLLNWTDSSRVFTAWADPYRPILSRELICSSSGDTLMSKEVFDARKRAGVHLPTSWRVQFGQGANLYSLRLKLSKLRVNEGWQPQEMNPSHNPGADSLEVRHAP